MKMKFTGILLLAVAAAWTINAYAFARANRAGGSTSHSAGETSHENRAGGSSTHEAGQGTEHTNTYGGSTAHAAGGGTEHTNVYGGSTYGAAGAGVAHTYPSGATAYRPPTAVYPAYHSPVAVATYSTTCTGCAVAAGAVVGAAVGAAAASANTAAATSNAYAAGVAAGQASAPAPVMGNNYASLPAGAMKINKNGQTYYLSGNTWFQPSYGANGVFYTVVPMP